MTSAKHGQGKPPAAAGPEAPAAPQAAAAPEPSADIAPLQQQLEEKSQAAQENYERALRLAANWRISRSGWSGRSPNCCNSPMKT